MSFEIPDIKQFKPVQETPSGSSGCTDCEDVAYTNLKGKIITAMSAFKDPTKHMVSVVLDCFPSEKLIKELQEKNYNVKYEVAYDGKNITGSFRVYRPGYVSSGMNDVFDVFTTSAQIDPQLSDKFKNIMEKFAQF